MSYQEDVEQFMEAADQRVSLTPERVFDNADSQTQLYMSLIQEEFDETMDAFAKGDTIVGDEIQGNLFFRNKKDIKKVEDLVEEVDIDENTDSTDSTD